MLGGLAAFGILKTFWKPLAIIGLVVAVGTFGYIKGRTDCARKIEKKIRIETEKRREAVENFRSKSELWFETNEVLIKAPNDERDSCILSGDPYKTGCLQ